MYFSRALNIQTDPLNAASKKIGATRLHPEICLNKSPVYFKKLQKLWEFLLLNCFQTFEKNPVGTLEDYVNRRNQCEQGFSSKTTALLKTVTYRLDRLTGERKKNFGTKISAKSISTGHLKFLW